MNIALHHITHSQGNRAGFLRNYDNHGIRSLRQTNAGAVAQAHAAILQLAVGYRQNGGCGHNTLIVHNNCAVVQQRLGHENRANQLTGVLGIQLCAGLGILLKLVGAADGNKRPVSLGYQIRHRLANQGNEVLVFLLGIDKAGNNLVGTQTSQCRAQLRLEQDDQNGTRADDECSKLLKHHSMCQFQHKIAQNHRCYEPGQNSRSTRILHRAIQLVEQGPEHHNLKKGSEDFEKGHTRIILCPEPQSKRNQ